MLKLPLPPPARRGGSAAVLAVDSGHFVPSRPGDRFEMQAAPSGTGRILIGRPPESIPEGWIDPLLDFLDHDKPRIRMAAAVRLGIAASNYPDRRSEIQDALGLRLSIEEDREVKDTLRGVLKILNRPKEPSPQEASAAMTPQITPSPTTSASDQRWRSLAKLYIKRDRQTHAPFMTLPAPWTLDTIAELDLTMRLDRVRGKEKLRDDYLDGFDIKIATFRMVVGGRAIPNEAFLEKMARALVLPEVVLLLKLHPQAAEGVTIR